MREFNFNLEKLLVLKSYAEKESSLELAGATGKYLKIANNIEEFKNKKNNVRKIRYSQREGESSVKLLVYAEEQLFAIKEKIEQLEKDLVKADKEREKVRLKYVEALKEKRIFEKLKEKKAAEHKKNEIDREEMVLEDIAVSNFSRLREAKKWD